MTNEEQKELNLKRRANEEERIKLAVTVDELIEELKKYPGNLPVLIENFGYSNLVDQVYKWGNASISKYSPIFEAVTIRPRT